ncbi:MAG: hypothetical protein O2794_03670 [bacterium]|nr:hypothetical protein [bacterium]
MRDLISVRPMLPSELGQGFPELTSDKDGYARIYEDGKETLIWTNPDLPLGMVPQPHEIQAFADAGRWDLVWFALMRNQEVSEDDGEFFGDDDDDHCCRCDGCDEE